MRLATILDPSCVVLDVGSASRHDVLACLTAPIAVLRPDLDESEVLAELERRELESSTAIADGIAIPHARPDCRETVTAGLGRSARGVDFGSLDGKPTRLFVVLVSPASNPVLHVTWLAHIARVLSDAQTRVRLLEAGSPAEVLDVLAERERDIEADDHDQSKVAG